MKFMPALAAEANTGGALALEAQALNLTTEGLMDVLKAPFKALKEKFALTDEEKFFGDIILKQRALEAEKKTLLKVKSQISQSRDTGNHTVSTKNLAGHANFSATTVEEVIAGVARNRKFIKTLISQMSSAKSIQAGQAILDKYDAEMAKKGTIAASMTVTREQALKALDEHMAIIDTMGEFLGAMETLARSGVSMEGVGSFFSNWAHNIGQAISHTWNNGVVWFFFCVFFFGTLYLFFVVIKGFAKTLAGDGPSNETISNEGVMDVLKSPLKALKASFATNDQAAFAKSIASKKAALEGERKNLANIKTSISQSRDNKTHSIDTKSMMGKCNFNAKTVDEVIAGVSRNRKFLRGLIGKLHSAKTSAEGTAIFAEYEAEMSKKGTVVESMTVTRDQALKAVGENLAVVNTFEEFLNAVEELSKHGVSMEGLGDFFSNWFHNIGHSITQTWNKGLVWFVVVIWFFGIFYLAFITIKGLVGAVAGVRFGEDDQAPHLTANKQ